MAILWVLLFQCNTVLTTGEYILRIIFEIESNEMQNSGKNVKIQMQGGGSVSAPVVDSCES